MWNLGNTISALTHMDSFQEWKPDHDETIISQITMKFSQITMNYGYILTSPSQLN